MTATIADHDPGDEIPPAFDSFLEHRRVAKRQFRRSLRLSCAVKNCPSEPLTLSVAAEVQIMVDLSMNPALPGATKVFEKIKVGCRNHGIRICGIDRCTQKHSMDIFGYANAATVILPPLRNDISIQTSATLSQMTEEAFREEANSIHETANVDTSVFQRTVVCNTGRNDENAIIR